VKEEIMKTIKIRVWREGTGKWHYCDDALPNLDARGPGYPTRPAAVRAARERYLDSPDPAERTIESKLGIKEGEKS
jgi:hypothetical protein